MESIVNLPSALDIRNEDSFKWVSFMLQSYIMYGFSFLPKFQPALLQRSPYTFGAILRTSCLPQGLPGGSDGKASVCDAGDPGSSPGLGRSPGEGNGSPLQYSCLENPMDGGAQQATVHGVAESDRTEQLHFHFGYLTSQLLIEAGIMKETSLISVCQQLYQFSKTPGLLKLLFQIYPE